MDSLGREPEGGQSSVCPSLEACALTQNSNIDGTGETLTQQGYFAELLFLKKLRANVKCSSCLYL